MTPHERAKRIITLKRSGGRYIVNLTDNCWRVLLSLSDSLPHADQMALMARHILAGEFARALADEDCRIAAEVDQLYLAGRIHYPSQVSRLCREMAQLHTIGAYVNGQADRHKPR